MKNIRHPANLRTFRAIAVFHFGPYVPSARLIAAQARIAARIAARQPVK